MSDRPDAWAERRRAWRVERLAPSLERLPERRPRFSTLGDLPVEGLYGPWDWAGVEPGGVTPGPGGPPAGAPPGAPHPARAGSATDLADSVGVERPTLARNLERLEKLGLIVARPGEGRRLVHELTAEGEARLAAAIPLWRQAQEALVKALPPDHAGTIFGELALLRAAARRPAGRRKRLFTDPDVRTPRKVIAVPSRGTSLAL